jgi:hypothetical protein
MRQLQALNPACPDARVSAFPSAAGHAGSSACNSRRLDSFAGAGVDQHAALSPLMYFTTSAVVVTSA